MRRGDPGVLFSGYSACPPYTPKPFSLSRVPWDMSCGITELMRTMMARLHVVENHQLLAPATKASCNLKFVDAYNVVRSSRSA